MADPVLINKYIKSLNLTGKEADKKRKELEKLSDSELNMLISNKKKAEKGETFGLNYLEDNSPKFMGNLFPTAKTLTQLNFGLEITTEPQEKTPVYTENEENAMKFLTGLTDSAAKIVEEREKEAGALSTVVNAWKEIRKKELAKSNVKKEINETKTDLEMLKKAASGEITKINYLTGEAVEVTFQEMFKERRGVKFDENAIRDCIEKAEVFARVKTATEMITRTKQELAFATRGDVTSQMSPDKSSAAIIKAFKLSGVTRKDDINKTLQDISEKYKNHPDVKKYGGDFRLGKDKKGKYLIYRTAKNGFSAEATNEELRLIAKEMTMRLNIAYASALGTEVPENTTSEEIENLTQQTYNRYQMDYEKAFAKAYGKKDLKALSEKYVQAQQEGVANIEAAINIGSMALMVIPGGAVATSGWLLKGSVALKNTANGVKLVRTLGLVDKAKSTVRFAQGLQKVQQIASPFIMGNMILRPTELVEQLSSENGMNAEEWEKWGKGVLQNSIYMSLGMGASKIAERAAAMYKTRALVSTLNKAGKSTDEIIAMVKANPVKFPADICSSFKNIDNLAKALQVSSEVALDISSTYLANKAMNNGNLTKQDWFMSVGFALSGGVIQKQFAPLSTKEKISYLQNAFKDINISKEEAQNILKAMDDISSGKKRVKKTTAKTHSNTSQAAPKAIELPEVLVKPKTAEPPAAQPASAVKKPKKNTEQRLKNEAEDKEFLEFQKQLERLREDMASRETDDFKLSVDNDDIFFERLNDAYEKIKPEEYENASKLIKNPAAKELAQLRFEAGELGKGELQLLEDISLGLENLTDTKVKNYINDELNKCKTADADDVTDILDNANKVIDAYHTLNGDYTRYTKQNFMATDFELTTPVEYLQFLRAVYPEKAVEFEQYISNTQKGLSGNDISRGDKNLVKDFIASQKTEALKDLAAYSREHEMADYLYKEVYLKRENLPQAVKDKCIEIADKYKSKIFLSAESDNALKEVSLIEEEYKLWADVSENKAAYPRVLDMHKINKSYIDRDAAHGSTAAGESRMAGPTVYIDGSTEQKIRHALRHELMHQNDGKSLSRRFAKETKPLMDEIMPSKTITRHGRQFKVLDYDNCKYRDEFLNAGISPNHIRYAYNSREEFLAVAAEADMHSFSPEFKDVLKTLGMPDYVFELPVTNPKIKRNVDIISEIRSDFPEEKDFNKLAEYFNDELEMISFFSMYKNAEKRGQDAELMPEIKQTESRSFENIPTGVHEQGVTATNVTQKQAETKQHLENACKVNGEISKELMQAAVKIQKYGVSADGAATIIEKYKDANGKLNPEIMILGEKLNAGKLAAIPDMVDVCINADGKINETIVNECINLKKQGATIYGIPYLIAASKDLNGNFSKENFDRITNLLVKTDKPAIKLDDAGRILRNCLTGNKLDENLLNKAVELKQQNFNVQTIEKAIEASKDGNGKFSEKNYEQVLILINSGIKDYNIADITNVLKQNGIIDENLIERAVKLYQNGVKQFNIADWFKKAQDKDGYFSPELFSKLEELAENPKTISHATWIIGASLEKNGKFNETNYKIIKMLFEDMPLHLQKKILTIVQTSVDENNVMIKDYFNAAIDLTTKGFDNPSIRLIMQSCKNNNNQGAVFAYDLFNKTIAAVDGLTQNSSSPLKTASLVLEEGKVSLKCQFADTTVKTHRFDTGMNDLKAELVETVQRKAGKEPVKITKSTDFEHNFQTKIRKSLDATETVINEVNIIKDKNGNVIRTEYLSPSDVPGIYDFRIKTPDGQTKVISSGTVDAETGFTLVEKNMESLDGTVTKYRYEDDPQGNRIIDYTIVDRDGNILMNDSQTFEVISDTKIISSYNDKVYEINIDGGKLTVEGKTTDEYAEFNLDTFLAEKSNKEMLLNLLKQLPGHELINLNKKIKTLSSTDVKIKSIHQAALEQIITADDLSILLHEAGHAKHSFGVYEIEFNDEFKQIFNKEREAFKKAFPDLQQKYLEYFISEESHSKGFIPRKEGWLQETAAETNSLLNTYYHSPELQIRAQYLQQYFPKTIAKLSEIMKSKELELARPTAKKSASAQAALTAVDYNNAMKNLSLESFTEEMIAFMKKADKDLTEDRINEFRNSNEADDLYKAYQEYEDLFIGFFEKDSNGEYIYADQEKYDQLFNIMNTMIENGKNIDDLKTEMEQCKNLYKYLETPEKYTENDIEKFGISKKQFDLLQKLMYDEYKNYKTDDYYFNKIVETVKSTDDKIIDFMIYLSETTCSFLSTAAEIAKELKTDSMRENYTRLSSYGFESQEILTLTKLMEIPGAKKRIDKLLKMEDNETARKELITYSKSPFNYDYQLETAVDRGLFDCEKLSAENIKKLIYMGVSEFEEHVVKRGLLKDDTIPGDDIYRLANLYDESFKLFEKFRKRKDLSISEIAGILNIYNIDKHCEKYNLLEYKQLKTHDDWFEICNMLNYNTKDAERLVNRKEIFESEHLTATDIVNLVDIDDQYWPRVIRRGMLQDKTLNGFQISSLAFHNDADYKIAVERDIVHNMTDIDHYKLDDLIKFSRGVYDAYMELKNNPPENLKKHGLNWNTLKALAEIPDADREAVMKFIYFENRGGNQLVVNSIAEYLHKAKNVDTDYHAFVNKMLEFSDMEVFVNQKQSQLNMDEIFHLTKMYSSSDTPHYKEVYERTLEILTDTERNASAKRLTVQTAGALANNEVLYASEHIITPLNDPKEITRRLMYIPERGQNQLEGEYLKHIAERLELVSDIDKYKEFLFSPEREANNVPQLSSYSIYSLISGLKDGELAAAKDLMWIKEKGKEQFDHESIINLAQLTPEQRNIAKEFYHIEGRTYQFYGSAIADISKYNETQLTRFRDLVVLEGIKPDRQPKFDTLQQLCSESVSDKTVEKFIQMKKINDVLYESTILDLCVLEDKYYEQACKLVKNSKSSQVSADYIKKFAVLEPEVFEKAVKYLENSVQAETALTLASAKDPQIYEKYMKAIDEAKAKRNQLKSGQNDLTDSDIYRFFTTHSKNIILTIDMLGLPAFTYAYTSKLNGLTKFTESVAKLQQNMGAEQYSRLSDKLKDKSIEPQDKIAKIRALSSIIPKGTEFMDYFYKFIDLIQPNSPTKEEVQRAKAIWANPKAKFADKFNEFCETFGLDKDNKKVIEFFDKRAQVNSKGYKILNGVKENEIAKLLEIEVVKKRNTKAWNEAIDKKIYDTIGVQYSPELSARLNLAGNKYLAEILSGNQGFKENFKDMVEEIKEHPDKSIRDIFNDLPQNIETKRQYAEYGIDYDRWVDADKNSYRTVKVEASAEKQKQAAIENMEADLNDPSFNALPKEETDKIIKALEEIGITTKTQKEPVYDIDGFIMNYKDVIRLYEEDTPVSFNKMEKAISVIKKVINENEFWTTTHSNSTIDSHRVTMYNHLMKLRDNEIKNAARIKEDKITTLEVHKTDMNNISHSLFLGNHSACCTAVASSIGNDFAAPRYIMDKCISAIEVMDGNEFVGNTMCYFAEVDGKLSLVLDNIEMIGEYQNNDKIRDTMMDYAKQLCEEVGKPDIPIYAGPYRHKLNMKPYSSATHDIKILGSTDREYTYIDFQGKYIIDGQNISNNIDLFKIR